MSQADCLRFLPKDGELVLWYLLKKVKGEPLPSADVTDCEIYGDKEPWKIFGNTSKKFYVFTKLKKKGKGKRIERRVGCGTWKGQNTNHVKDPRNNHIVGFKKLFVFEVKGSNADNGHWLMHEYSLVDDQSDYVLCAIRNKHGIDVVDDDQPQRKRIRFNEDHEQNSFTEAATPVSTLDSEEALGFAVASNAFIEPTPASTLASEEALGFAAVSNAFTGLTSASTLAQDHEALMGFAAASKSEDRSFTNEQFAITPAVLDQLLLERSDRDLSEAEDARQVLISNALVQATNALALKRSFQQQSMVTTAAESVSTSVSLPSLEYINAGASAPALDYALGASAMAFDVGVETAAAPTFLSDEALGFVAASNSLTEATPATTLASDHEALTGFAASSNCEDHGLFSAEQFAAELLSEGFDRVLFEAEDARQVLIPNESVQATIALELNTSLQQQSMERFSNNNTMEDMQTSLTTAAGSVPTSASAMAFDEGFSLSDLGDMSFLDMLTTDYLK